MSIHKPMPMSIQTCLYTGRYLQLRPSVTEDLQSRIDQFYQYKWALHGGVQGEVNLFSDLHPHLRSELLEKECADIIKSVTLFRSAMNEHA